METLLQEFSERIRQAGAGRTPLRIRGGGSKDWYGQAPQGELLDTRPYCGIVDYEPTELVITARCGTPLAEIEAALAGQGQMLAFEPPHFGPATLGGAVAAGLSGPRRQSAGALRDFVLGAVLMDGRGEVLHFGGQVMKNVAGYDVSRLLAGSLGSLGLILEVSLKVLPRAAAELSLGWEMGQEEALARMEQWAAQPLPVSATAWHQGVLQARLSGVAAAVTAARARLGGAEIAPEDAPWPALREQQHEFFQTPGPQALWRLALPACTPPLALPGPQLIEWNGGQRWLRSDAAPQAIREAARAAGGHAVLFRGGDKAQGVFQPLAPALAAIHGRLKQAFDPAAIFNPGRMYPEP